MNKRVRAIIIDNGEIALMKRVKGGKTYYVIPGGGVEEGEDLAQALHREIKEELGIEISIGDLFYQGEHEGPDDEMQTHYFYLCKETGGAFGKGNGPEYDLHNQDGENGTHEPVRLPLAQLKGVDLYPEEVRYLILEKYSK